MNANNGLAQVPPPWVSAHWPFLVFNTIDSYLWAFLNFHHHVYPWVFLSFHHHRHPWVLLNFHHHHGSSSIFTTIDLYLLAFSIFLIMDFIHEHSLLFTTMDPYPWAYFNFIFLHKGSYPQVIYHFITNDSYLGVVHI